MLRVPAPVVLSAVPVALVAVFLAFNASGSSGANPIASPTPPTALATEVAASDVLPDGASGNVTYRTDDELVTVELPSRKEIHRQPYVGGRADIISADREWRVHETCATAASSGQSCHIDFVGRDGASLPTQLSESLQWSQDLQWSPSGHILAVRDWVDAASRLVVIEDPASGQQRVLLDGHGTQISSYAWLANGSIIAAVTGGPAGAASGPRLVDIAVDAGGAKRDLVRLPEEASYLYPSPNHTQFAFTQNGLDGWHLDMYDATSGEIADFGPMGSDGPGATPVPMIPDVKTPMYIAWSPDSSRIAFGGGFDPPYTMTIVDVASRSHRTTDFAEGYPGEIKWKPGGGELAVSTYDPQRTRHEVYIVDPATGAARHLIPGCIIVWSPDGRFMAVHKDHEYGIVVADVTSGAYGFLTHEHADAVGWAR